MPRIDPRTAWTLAAIIGIPLLFFALLFVRVETRSFHQDELYTLHVEKRAEADIILERQHGHFHQFYQWWLRRDFGERHARLPSIFFVTLGMLSLALLAWRLWGRDAAVIACVAYFLWPRAWDDGLEMRYYSMVFLAATVGLHALLSMTRGRLLWPAVVLVGLLAFMHRWHPTATPFHLGLAVAVIVFAGISLVTTLQSWRKSREPNPFPWKQAIVPGLIVFCAIAGFVAVLPRLYADDDLAKIMRRIGQVASMGDFRVSHLAAWFINWVDDRYAPAFPLLRVLRLSLPALVITGVGLLTRKHRAFAIVALSLLVFQIIISGIFSLSWNRMSVGYKYVTSSSVLLLLAVSIASAWLIDMSRRRSPQFGFVCVAALAIGYFIPVAPRVAISALGDGSHYRAVWQTILQEAPDEAPIVYAPSTTAQGVRPYQLLLPDGLNVTLVASYDHPEEILPSLLARNRPVFLPFHPSHVEDLNRADWFHETRSYTSNYTPTWDVTLLQPTARRSVAAGEAIDLEPGGTILVVEESRWRVVEGTAHIGGQEHQTGESLAASPGQLIAASESTGQLRTIPDYASHGIVRQGGISRRGPIEEDNHPAAGPRGLSYRLTAALPIEYLLYIPESGLLIDVHGRLIPQTGNALIAVLDDQLLGIFSLSTGNSDNESAFTVRLIIPGESGGGMRRVTLSPTRNSPHYKDPAADIEELWIDALEIRPPMNGETASPNHLEAETLALPPPWTAGGLFDFADPRATSLLTIDAAELGRRDVGISSSQHGVALRLPAEMESTLIYLPPFHVVPESLLVMQMELRSENLIQKNAIPLMHYLNDDGDVLVYDSLGEKPVGSGDVNWTPRLGVSRVPEGASIGLFGVYINAPPELRSRDDGRVELKTLRFLQATDQK